MEVIADRFELGTQVSSGAMGVVFRGRDRATGAPVAIKFIRTDDDASRQRFAREATILATLTHPAIVRHVAHGLLADGTPFLVMAWVEGETLEQRLARAGLTIAEAIALGRRLADALAHAHAHGVVHRDVKPGNLILRDRELEGIAVVDFGIARAASAVTSMTATGTVVGSPGYLSPEQARGEKDIDARTDVFALGCVLYECLTGQMAFEGRHALALIAKAVVWEPPRPRALNPAIPEALDDLVMAMLAKPPEARPADGAAVVARLDALALDARREVVVGALAAPPAHGHDAPRPRAGAAATTIATPRAVQVASLVIASGVAVAEGLGPALEPDALAARRAQLDRVALDAVRVELLLDGTVIAILDGPAEPEALVRRALGCARALRAAFPELLIAVKTDLRAAAAGATALLEPTLAALSKEAMAALFAGVASAARPAGAIRLDDVTATLAAGPAVIRVAGVAYLVGDLR